jgi:predicted nuclease of restriction endonuclease-like (RecB) superfamily
MPTDRRDRSQLVGPTGVSASGYGALLTDIKARIRLAQIKASLSLADPDRRFLPQAVAEIPWGHNVTLLEKLNNTNQRLWYAKQAIMSGWSRSMLEHWIESDLYSRQGKAVTNFETALPQAESDLARDVMRDPYNFDFLALREQAEERELEEGLLKHIRKFLIELGAGFAFVGQQIHLVVDSEDYYIDLLFYHLKLRRYVVIDLKTTSFKPEYAGQDELLLVCRGRSASPRG